MWPLVAAAALGLGLGARHAFEPDHLAAVSTLVAERPRPRQAAALGALWGLGHTAALLAVGVVLALVGGELPARLAEVFEFGVALMLIGLGLRAIQRATARGQVGPAHTHHHRGRQHHHHGPAGHVHLGRWTFAARPLLVGVVHGLAGSGSLTALVLAGLPTTAARLGYILLFGLGLVAGMAVLSGLAGLPLSRAGRNPRVARGLGLATGTFSAVLGVLWGLPLLRGWLG